MMLVNSQEAHWIAMNSFFCVQKQEIGKSFLKAQPETPHHPRLFIILGLVPTAAGTGV